MFANIYFNNAHVGQIYILIILQSGIQINLVALEDTRVTTISYDSMEALCRNYHSMETFFRKLLSVAATKMTKRISEMLEGDATERYRQFVAENSAILQRINVGDIANYLGITPQSLSRIRRG